MSNHQKGYITKKEKYEFSERRITSIHCQCGE